MSDDKTGGPAFPAQFFDERATGMSLRDYFAANCPITWTEAQEYNDTGFDEVAFFANVRYEYADAMIAERAK